MPKRLLAIFLALTLCAGALPVLAAPDNLSYGALAEASFYDANGKKMGADTKSIRNLTDGNEYSAYRSTLGTQSAEYVIDLFATESVNAVYISEMNTTILGYTLSVSLDKRSWTKVYSGEKIGAFGKTIHFPDQKARFIRLEVTKTDNTYHDAVITIKEFQVYRDNGASTKDLSNSIYLMEKKQQQMKQENMRRHYNEADDAAVAETLESAKQTLSASASQTELDAARDSVDRLLWSLEDKVVPTAEDYSEVRALYFEQYTGNSQDPESASRKQTLERTAANCEAEWSKMITNPKSIELWSEFIPPRANPAQEQGKINESFSKLKTMAIAYKQIGNKYYNDPELLADILYGIDFLLNKKYDPSIVQYGNWYGWVVSTPAVLTDLLILLYDELSKETIDQAVKAMEYRTGSDSHYTRSGANRMYTAASALKIAVTINSEEYMHRVRYSLAEESAYRDKQNPGDTSGGNDGYYWDGSYMFHSGYMYNATYGRDQLTNTMGFVTKLYGSIWQVDQYLIDDLASRLVDGYEAIIYNGNTVDATAGRGLGSGKSYGATIAESISQVADYVDEPWKSTFKSIAKEIKLDNGVSDKLTKDASVIPRGDITRLKRYPVGDKLVLHRPEFGFGLSMFSNRTKTYEAPNGDAMKAWYVSSGTTYLLNDDTEQFDRDFWIAVDHYRIPGTTVDRVMRTTTRFEGEMFNIHDWSGMMDIDELYGNAGMQINNWNSNVSGNKSYFIFDNEIVCLGSGITGGSDTIETTVDNKKIADDLSTKLIVDGKEIGNGSQEHISGAKTAWLEGNVEGNDYGYYFPEGEEINAIKETRTEKEADMWLSDTDATVTKSFATMWIDHGKNPKNADYSYVLLPNQSQEQVEEYAAAPEIEIISRTNDVHAVRDSKLGVTGYNFFAKGGAEAGGVTSSGPLVMTTKEDDRLFEVSMTDPVFSQTKPVVVTFDTNVDTVISSDAAVKVLSTAPLKLEVNLKDINGQKLSFKASKTPLGYDAGLLAGAVVMQDGKDTALSDNEAIAAPAPVTKNGALYLPADFVAGQLGSRFAQDGDRVQLIGERILQIEEGTITIDGKQNAASAIMEDGRLYLPLALLGEFYNVKTYEMDGTGVLGWSADGARQDETITNVKKYMGWE